MSASTLELLLDLQNQLMQLREDALQLEARLVGEWDGCQPDFSVSARNLIHYLSVRQKDIRLLQYTLSRHGFSSLSHIEPYTLSNLNSALAVVEQFTGHRASHPMPPVDFQSGPELLRQHSNRLLGEASASRPVRIMVTMPSEAATNPLLIKQLLAAGMNVMRINCAHDTPQQWAAMVKHLRQAERELGVSCKVQADLAGPKLRTGALPSAGRVLKLKPKRDIYGRILSPCRVLLTSLVSSEPLPAGVSHRVQLSAELMSLCDNQDHLQLVDSRSQKRHWHIIADHAQGFIAELYQTTYVSDQTQFALTRGEKVLARSVALNIPDIYLPIVLNVGDGLILTKNNAAGCHAQRDKSGQKIADARIHCTLDLVFEQVQQGLRVWFDDGKIGAIVESVDGQAIRVKITHAEPGGSKLRAEKGINFPDAALQIPALTEKDLADLKHVVTWADMVALSFVRSARDVHALHEKLSDLQRPDMGMVLKIENRQAFEQLPAMLLAGLHHARPFGVMIARGDLAVEVGFERLSEVQQEILWLCEAAHVPVIWATQILETMTKKGLPSRAEISDAGMCVAAECAMLNKGPYIVETVNVLCNIIDRMDQHSVKRRVTLRKLAVAQLDSADKP